MNAIVKEAGFHLTRSPSSIKIENDIEVHFYIKENSIDFIFKHIKCLEMPNHEYLLTGSSIPEFDEERGDLLNGLLLLANIYRVNNAPKHMEFNSRICSPSE